MPVSFFSNEQCENYGRQAGPPLQSQYIPSSCSGISWSR